MDNIIKRLENIISNKDLQIHIHGNYILIGTDDYCIISIYKKFRYGDFLYEDNSSFLSDLTEDQAIDCAIELICSFKYYKSIYDPDVLKNIFALY